MSICDHSDGEEEPETPKKKNKKKIENLQKITFQVLDTIFT